MDEPDATVHDSALTELLAERGRASPRTCAQSVKRCYRLPAGTLGLFALRADSLVWECDALGAM